MKSVNYLHLKYKANEAYQVGIFHGKRIPELEPVIMKKPSWAYRYAKDVIKGRWLEVEQHIKKNETWIDAYLAEFPEARTPSKDVPLVLGNYAVMDVPNTITDEQVIKLISILEPQITSYNCRKWRMYYDPRIKQQLYRGLLRRTTTQCLLTNESERNEFLSHAYNTDFR